MMDDPISESLLRGEQLDNLATLLNQPPPGCSSNTKGTALLFKIVEQKPSFLKAIKLQGSNVRCLKPEQCSRGLIDNTNLHDAF